MKKPSRRIPGMLTLAAGIPLATLALCLLAALAPFNRTASAACADEPTEDITFPTALTPAPDGLGVQGPAPLFVLIAFDGNEVIVPSELTSSLDWGDGSGGPSMTIVTCGDDLYSWPPQQHSHTYTTPGDYVVLWKFSTPSGLPVVLPDIPVLFVRVGTAAAATPVPATPTPVPAVATATSVPQFTNTPAGATAVPTVAESVIPGASPGPSVTAAAATVSSTPTPTPLPPTPTPTPTATQAAVVVAAQSPTATQSLPQLFLDVPDPADISTDPGVVSTNLALAGITVWVFFSSVLFNQTMQEHRGEISGWTRRLRPSIKLPKFRASGSAFAGVGIWAAVLGGTGIIYGFLEPGFGLNRTSFVLFASVVIGVGIVGTFYSSLEAWSRRRRLSVTAAVRAYPFSLVVAAVCVATSRLLDLHPGVIYGFAASCVVIDASSRNDDPEGRALVVPLTACLSLSVACWLILGFLRSVPGALASDILEGVAIIVFVGGLEGLFVNLIPLQVMDGAKIYRWNRRIWLALVLVTAFLVWHVLLNSQGAYFESVRKASSLSVLLAFLVYTSAGVGLWGYFAIRKRRERPASASGA